MLLFSPVATAMSNINEVHATGLEAYYGAQLFEMILSTYGVSQLGDSASKEKTYREFGEYLNSIDKPDVWSIFQGFSQNNPKVRITKEILSPVYSFLIKKFGSLTSKSQQLTYSGYKYQSAELSGYDLMCKDYADTYNVPYFMLIRPEYSGTSLSRVSCTGSTDNYSDGYVISSAYNDTQQCFYFVKFNSYGVVRAIDNFYMYNFDYSTSSGKLSPSGYVWKLANQVDNTCQVVTTIPFIRTNMDYSALRNHSLSEILSSATVKPAQAVSSASWGSYNKKTIDAITDKEIDSSTVLATVASAGSAVKENTTTSDTGEDTYSDTIASAVATAVAKALTDAGVISKDNTGTDTGDKEETETPAGLMAILAEILSAIKAIPQFFTDNILDAVYGIRDAVKPLGGYIADARDKVVAGIESIPAYIESTSDKIADVIEGAQAVLAGIFSNVLDEVKAIPKSMADIFTDVIEGAKTGWLTLWDWLKKILDAILAIPGAIADVLSAIFVPDLTESKEAIETFQNKFTWVETLHNSIKSNLTALKPDSAPPVIYLDFTQAGSSKYVPVGKQIAVDFSWYAKYKPTGDAVIGSFMWIVYLWYLWKRLPDIISGGGMLTMNSMEFENSMAKKNSKKKGE